MIKTAKTEWIFYLFFLLLLLFTTEYEMSEVMVITGSGTKATTFEGCSSNLSEIASVVGNGVHSRNGSLRGNVNGFKCRCMMMAAAAASTDSKEGSNSSSSNAATATEDSATEEASGSAEKDKKAPLTAASLSTELSSAINNHSNEPVKREHKSTQTVVSIVNGGINGGINVGSTSTRTSIDVGTTYSNSEPPPVDNNALPNQLSI